MISRFRESSLLKQLHQTDQKSSYENLVRRANCMEPMGLSQSRITTRIYNKYCSFVLPQFHNRFKNFVLGLWIQRTTRFIQDKQVCFFDFHERSRQRNSLPLSPRKCNRMNVFSVTHCFRPLRNASLDMLPI